MIKLVQRPERWRAMSDDDIFLSRLKLLIIMARAYLKDWPISKSAIIENPPPRLLSFPEIGQRCSFVMLLDIPVKEG